MEKFVEIKKKEALDYHKHEKPGKLEIQATKTLNSQRDLSLAYSPRVAVPCEEIARDSSTAYEYTAKGNLVAVITNGTAVLGLGDIGALASKPVMEGKAVLFKKFAKSLVCKLRAILMSNAGHNETAILFKSLLHFL